MTSIEMLALTRLLNERDEKAVRNQVSPGSYKVDFCVHVAGDMEVKEDYQKRPTVSVPWTEAYTLLRLVALQAVDEMISRVDRGETITRDHLEAIKRAGFLSEDVMVETMERAFDLRNAPRGEGCIAERIPEVEAAVEKVKELIAGRLGLTPSKGMVKADLNFNQIQPAREAPEGSANTAQVAGSVPPSVNAPQTT